MGKMIRPFCWHQNFVPWGCLPLPRGYIQVLNHEKNCIKSDFKDIFFERATNEWSDKKAFLLKSNFIPWGLSAPAPGLYTCIKSWKKLYKIRLRRDFLKLATNDRSDKMFLLTSKFCPQGVVSPCPGAIYMYKIMLFFFYKIRLQRDFFWTCSSWLKWQELSVDIKILSPGVVCPWPAAIYIY